MKVSTALVVGLVVGAAIAAAIQRVELISQVNALEANECDWITVEDNTGRFSSFLKDHTKAGWVVKAANLSITQKPLIGGGVGLFPVYFAVVCKR